MIKLLKIFILILFVFLGVIQGYSQMVTPGVESGEVYVESEDAQPYLKRAEKLEKAGQWRRAIKQYEFIIRKYPESVCPVDAGRFVGVKQYFFQRISQYPPAGLAVYRQMFDALSEGLFNKAVEDSDVIILRRLADEMFFSAYGDNAADFLADLMVEQGYLDEALRYWNQLLEFYPDSEISRPVILLKVAVTYLRLGYQSDFERVKVRLIRDYAQVKINWGQNKEVSVESILNSFERISLATVAPLDDQSVWTTWGGNNAHNRIGIHDGMNDIRIWSKSIGFKLTQPSPSSRNRMRRGRQMPDSAIVAYPAVTPDFIYVNDGFRVRQLDPVTGDERAVFSGSLTDQDISRFQTAFRNNYIRLNGLFGVTLAGGKLFANIIRPSTNPALRNSYLPVSSVIALSAVSLKKLWSTDDLNDPFLSDINLFSPPIVSGQQVIVAGIKQIGVEAQVYLFSFDINTGSLRWKKFICSRMRRNRRRGRVNLVTPLLAEDKGLVFCNTNHGVVAAVVADNGSIVWLVNYLSQSSGGGRRPGVHGSGQEPLNQLNFPIVNKGVLCCLPDDRKEFFVFDVFTGQRLRPRLLLNLVSQSSFLGLQGDAVFFSGARLRFGDPGDRLFSSNLLDGKIQWGPFPSRDSELSMNLTDPGFLTEKCAYLNTKEGLIVVDLETKELKGPQAWAAPGRVRLMMTTQHGLLTVSDENISLYYDLERFLAEFKKEAELYPTDLKLLLNKYIQPLIDNQKIDQAIKSLVELKRRIDSAGLPIEERPVFDALVSKLMPLYALKGQRSFQAGKFEAAIEFWRAEQVLAREPSDLARINFRLAECAMATKSWAEALTLFHGVLVKYPGEYYEPLTGDKNRWRLKSNLYADRQIEAMIGQVGREIYQPVEKEARQFARRLDLKNPTDCLKFLETYPNSRRTNEVVFWLARRAHERGDYKGSLRWLRFLHRNHPDEDIFNKRILLMMDCYEQMNDLDGLVGFLERLTGSHPQAMSRLVKKNTKIKDYFSPGSPAVKKTMSGKKKLNFPLASVFKVTEKWPEGKPRERFFRQKGIPEALSLDNPGPPLPPELLLTARGLDVECWDMDKKSLRWIDSGGKSFLLEKSAGKPSDGSVPQSRLVGPDSLFINRGSYLQKTNVLTGKMLWHYVPESGYHISSVDAFNDKVFIAATLPSQADKKKNDLPCRKLICLDEKDGRVIWSWDFPEGEPLKIILSKTANCLVVLDSLWVKVVDNETGEILYGDELFRGLSSKYAYRIVAVQGRQVCYLNQKQELIRYDLVDRQKKVLRQFAGLKPNSVPNPWISLADNFVCVSGLSESPILFDLTRQSFKVLPKKVRSQIKVNARRSMIKTLCDSNGRIYFWLASVFLPKSQPPPRFSSFLLAYDSQKDRIMWKTPMDDSYYIEDVDFNDEYCLMTNHNRADRSKATLVVVGKNHGKRVWDVAFKYYFTDPDRCYFQIKNERLILSVKEGVEVYR